MSRLVLAALGCALVACSNGACSGSTRREAASLLAAMDLYERADDASKGVQAQAVAGVACSSAPVCEAKRACLAAITPTAQALALKVEVSARVGDLEAKRLAPDSAEALGLPEKLDRAARLLNEGRSKMPECERKLTDLRIASGA